MSSLSMLFSYALSEFRQYYSRRTTQVLSMSLGWLDSLLMTSSKCEVLSLSHLKSGLILHVSLMLLFGSLVAFNLSRISRWLSNNELPKEPTLENLGFTIHHPSLEKCMLVFSFNKIHHPLSYMLIWINYSI